MRFFLTLAALALGSLACTQAVITPTASPAPTATATTTPPPTASPAPSVEVSSQSATVRAALVNVRTEPDGEVVGQLEAGTNVQVIGHDESGDWVQIADPSGWVWGGCLEGINDKGCEAR